MNRNETYEAWKKRRGDVDVEAGFADRVMQQVVAPEDQPSDDARPANRSYRVKGHAISGVSTVAALLVVSLAVGLLRYGSVIALLLLMSSTGN